jgi:hypothetical protein
MPSYYLQPHVYACITSEAAIFLDLRRDEYVGLDHAQTVALSRYVRGWPEQQRYPAAETPPTDSNPTALADKLADIGLLTRDASKGKEATSIALPIPEFRLADPDLCDPPQIHLHHYASMLIACIRVKLSMRFFRLDRVLRQVEKTKSRGAGGSPNIKALSDLTHIFLLLRPFFYTHREMCLFDSLVLTYFLARYDQCATLVFGVKSVPFAAHAWVQLEAATLNAPLELALKFRPILAI